ncbi:hypothetical protein HKK80_00310 [Halonotius sp. F2-221B]|uniref:hypothetical protein n=1 Tax=Halonotius sp. F2-221B TaxID=2731620 RepID=UPI00398B9B8F
MSDTQTEACGRCSMSTVVDAVADDESNADRDPLTGDQIEVSETTLSRVAPGAWLGRVTTRLNEVAQQLTYNR